MAIKNLQPVIFAAALCAAAFAPRCFAQALTDLIVADQFGYRENAKKTAVVRSPQTGAGSPSSYNPAGAEFQVVSEEGGEAVFSGAAAAFNGGEPDAASGDKVWWFDFSGVTAPGRYYVVDKTNNLRSFSFNVNNGVYGDVLKAALRMLYYQRAGTDKPARYAGEGWADGMCFEQDKRARDFFAKSDASTERDLSGGWFDAGDYNKYTKWAADYIADLFLIYEERPGAFGDDYGIPESGNGVPDILDEAKWGLSWLVKMQNADGSVLSVQGLADGSPPSSVAAASYYGPPNATAAFGAARAYAIASRVLGGRGEAGYADQLKAAAVKAFEWGSAHPDSMFHNNCGDSWNKDDCPNYDSRGLAAGDQEITDNESTTGRLENRAAAAYYLYELTGEDTLLTIVEDAMKKFPLYAWGNFMDHYRHTSHLLYMRYLQNPNGNEPLKSEISAKMRAAFAKPDNFYGAYAKDGYRAFAKDYNWGSNKAKADYGVTFYKWNIVDPSADHKDIAEDYLHYIHGVNPLNIVYLTNMNSYGASNSLKSLYHTWFTEGSPKWDVTTEAAPGPAPGYLPGGPNQYLTWDGCCDAKTCGSAANNARCNLVELPKGLPPAKMYKDMNHGWPLNSWEFAEPMISYQLSYVWLLSKFAEPSGSASVSPRKPIAIAPIRSVQYKKLRRRIELRVRERAEVKIFSLSGALIGKRNLAGGVHAVSFAKLPKGVYVVRMAVDGERAVLRVPVVY
ncbi:MAG: glycoside hydrolase family 9 protein [Chitinispirillales bacterium]|jgi:hypothetical protein|nr:glycoside hydrolase family 9 protein [Chitinispirillales bacterium]